MGRIISKHKSILELDADLVKVINPKNIFVSYRGNPTLDRILAPSKLRSLNQNSDHDNTDQNSSVDLRQFGSFKCENECKMCKLFLHSPEYVTSFHTDQRFNFKHRLSCDSKLVIYLAEDLKCERSYTGSCLTSVKVRWGNHKSHIRTCKGTCELTSHFKEDYSNHPFSRSGPLKQFDENLGDHLRLTLIDQVDSESELKDRESYWMSQL